MIIKYLLMLYALLSSAIALANASYTLKNIGLHHIELANTAKERETGLMHRKKLCKHCAMLFTFPFPVNGGFWMKNTLISLDMIFLNAKGCIVEIFEHTKPLQTYPKYAPLLAYQFVLETNAGFSKQAKLKPGMCFCFNDIAKPFSKSYYCPN